MSQLPWSFDTATAERSTIDEPIPGGLDLEMVITDSEDKTTRSGGVGFVFETTIVQDGPYKNRKLWTFVNFLDPEVDINVARAKAKKDGLDALSGNEQSIIIGQRTIGDICYAVGFNGELNDTRQLHGERFIGRTRVQKNKTGEYPDKTIVSAWKPLKSGASTQATPAPTATPSEPKKPAWHNV